MVIQKQDEEIYFYYGGFPVTQNNITEYGAMIDAFIQVGLLYQEDIASGKLTSDELKKELLKPQIFKKEKKKKLGRGEKRKFIDEKLDISNVAKLYGLKVKKNRTKCIFHGGKNKTSLSFDDSINCFHCFSCGISGDIIELVRRLEEDGYKRRSD